MSCSATTLRGTQCSRKSCEKKTSLCSQHRKMRNEITLKKIEKSHDGKHKYTAIFDVNGREKKTSFGALGMSDYTIHKTPERKDRYIQRHSKDLRTRDPTRAGFLSMYVLWNKKSFDASVKDYKRRLKENDFSLPK